MKEEELMNNLCTNKEKCAKEVYDEEPVFYCEQCLSLRIKSVPGMIGMDYCDECNSTNIGRTNIKVWEKLYEAKHGYKFLDKLKY